MIYLLAVHIFLGLSLLVSFVARFIIVLSKKKNPNYGRAFVAGLGAALVTSGVALEIVTKSPLSSACLASLAVIFVVIGLEYLFYQLVKNRLLANK